MSFILYITAVLPIIFFLFINDVLLSLVILEMFILFIAVFIIQAISTSLVSTIFLVVLLVFAVVEAVVGLFLFVISVSWTSSGSLNFSNALPF